MGEGSCVRFARFVPGIAVVNLPYVELLPRGELEGRETAGLLWSSRRVLGPWTMDRTTILGCPNCPYDG